MSYVTRLLAPSLVLFSLLASVVSSPIRDAFVPVDAYVNSNTSYPFLDSGTQLHRRQGSKVPLRILSLGASIMYGARSTDGNGYIFL